MKLFSKANDKEHKLIQEGLMCGIKQSLNIDNEYNKLDNFYNEIINEVGTEEKKQEIINIKKQAQDEKMKSCDEILDIGNKLIDGIKPMEEDMMKWGKRNYISARLSWLLLILFIISLIRLSDFLGIVTIILIACVIYTIITSVKSSTYHSTYRKPITEATVKCDQIADNCINKCRTYRKEIDKLYLSSLDATTKQIVMMRRENAEREKQAEIDRKNIQKLQSELVNTQKQLAHAQAQTASATSELLDIEREREKRYGH